MFTCLFVSNFNQVPVTFKNKNLKTIQCRYCLNDPLDGPLESVVEQTTATSDEVL
jgi:hypothetical protein